MPGTIVLTGLMVMVLVNKNERNEYEKISINFFDGIFCGFRCVCGNNGRCASGKGLFRWW